MNRLDTSRWNKPTYDHDRYDHFHGHPSGIFTTHFVDFCMGKVGKLYLTLRIQTPPENS